jgi:paraquat-inducible protein B
MAWKCWVPARRNGWTAACASSPAAKAHPVGQYPLYGNSEKAAEAGIVGNSPTPTLTLNGVSLPDVQAGSVVLYRKFQVGEIVNVRPKANEFEVDVYISPEYRKLLSSESIFWAEGGAKVQLNGNGLTVQASPLNRALKGAISFDNLEGVTLDKGAKRVFCTIHGNRPPARWAARSS